MCGIAGMVGSYSPQDARGIVAKMVGAMHHRGPDGHGDFCFSLPGAGKALCLGHARLSIIDLTENASQPMRDPQTNSWLVYNGEIYNFRELRAELAGMGYSFISDGDTEVLLKALLAWGDQALIRLRGMYAFGFWDGRNQELILGRDPFGIKPLLLARTKDAVLFCSEIRALRASGILAWTLNPSAVKSFLTYGMVVEPETVINGVMAVPPGHVVTIDVAGKAASPKKILGIEDFFPKNGGNFASYDSTVNEVLSELEKSVKAHLVSDVPLGVFLSGGIDSSILATLARRASQEAHISFLTVNFSEENYSEVEYARQVVHKLGGTHHIIHLTADRFLGFLPRALSFMDQPTVDGVNAYVISNMAAQNGLKVLLSGLGADEVFGGYTTFVKAPFLFRNAYWLSKLAKIAPFGFWGRQAEWSKIVHSGGFSDLRDAYMLQRSIRWSSGTGLHPGNYEIGSVQAETSEQLANGHGLEDFKRISYMEMVFYMRNQLLRDADIFSSANSVELRVPYLQWELVRKAWNLPPSYHLSPFGRGKKILRDILRGLHPDIDWDRKKMGFLFPWNDWIRGPLYGRIADVLHSRSLYEDLGLDVKEGQRTLQAFKARNPVATWAQVWSLFVLLNWNERNKLSA